MKSIKVNKEVNTKMRGISKAIYIIARILWIIMIPITILIAIGGLLVIICVSNLKLDYNGNFTAFGEKVDFETSMRLTMGENYQAGIDIIKNIYEVDNGKSFTNFFKVAVVGGLIEVITLIILFNKLDKLFYNISNKSTPFTKENSNIIKFLGYGLSFYIIINFIFSIISNSILSLGGKAKLNLTFIVVILIIFSIAYIFDYAREIQNNLTGNE